MRSYRQVLTLRRQYSGDTTGCRVFGLTPAVQRLMKRRGKAYRRAKHTRSEEDQEAYVRLRAMVHRLIDSNKAAAINAAFQ